MVYNVEAKTAGSAFFSTISIVRSLFIAEDDGLACIPELLDLRCSNITLCEPCPWLGCVRVCGRLSSVSNGMCVTCAEQSWRFYACSFAAASGTMWCFCSGLLLCSGSCQRSPSVSNLLYVPGTQSISGAPLGQPKHLILGFYRRQKLHIALLFLLFWL